VEKQTFDFIIVGSGAACVPAALVMKHHGKSALIIEKQPVIGGSSAFSGGVIWIPNNHHVNAVGGNDSPEKARTYLDAVVGDVGPSTTAARKDAFIRNGSEMVRFLEGKGMQFLHAFWPDYYDTAPGGIATGRSLAAPLFNVKELGEWQSRLAHHPITSAMPVLSSQAVFLNVMKRNWRGRRVMAGVLVQMLKDRLLGHTTRGAGNALQGRLFQIALREQIPIWPDTPVRTPISEGGRVTGVVIERGGKSVEVGARLGVLINAGGFSRNPRMREQYLPRSNSVAWTAANPGDTGEMIESAMKLGAAIDLMNESVWEASSFLADGTLFCFHSPNDIAKPHCIVVERNGRRFANENANYVEFGQRMFAAKAVPAYAIFDSRHRQNYTWGLMPPGVTAKKFIDSGYMIRASGLAELAHRCGITAAGLLQTVERFNEFARKGVDEDFHRGEGAYGAYYGDPQVRPNSSLGTLERPPFYAVKLLPGDLGTTGGLVTDEFARVLRQDGSVIAGLYATGNSAASVFGRTYPGAGATMGPSMTFGYVAAKHAANVQ
jgi:3-oxosteroid 1-dehydrogenase